MADRLKFVEVEAYDSLCDFIAPVLPDAAFPRRERTSFRFDVRQLAKDAVEGAGIPHPEVDLLLIDGASAPFDRELRPGSLLQVFPIQHPMSSLHSSLVRPPPLPDMKFIVDENLGRLASALLMLGFDTLFDPRMDDARLAERSALEQRFVLTRDIGVLKRSIVTHGYWVRHDDPRAQVSEAIRRCDLWPKIKPFSRCLNCNVSLFAVPKVSVQGEVPGQTYELFDEFLRCPTCKKIYWKGSHYLRMTTWLESLEREFGPRL